MAGRWLTIKEASQVLGTSERTIRRHIKEGQFKSKLKNHRRLVLVDMTMDHGQDHVSVEESQPESGLVEQLRSENQYLRSQVETLQRQVEASQKEISESRERSDTLILNLQRQLEQSERMLESAEMKRDRRGWWSRLWKRKVE